MRKNKEFKTYSEAFKLALVEKIEQGAYNSLREAQRKNGISGVGTVKRWIQKYGQADVLPKRVRITTMKEIDELKVANERIKTLEKALSYTQVAWLVEKSSLEIACEKLGIAPETLKKKIALEFATGRGMPAPR